MLLGYPWPGNARELRLAVERACALAPDACLSPAVLAEAIERGAPISGPVDLLNRGNGDGPAEALRSRFVETLAAHHWDAGRAATALGVHRATLFRHLKGFGLSIRSLRKSH